MRKKEKFFVRTGISDFNLDRHDNYNEISYPFFLIYRLFSICKSILIKKYYSKISKSKIKSKNYVFFALHMQPEKTTNPMGGIFDDQVYTCDLIKECLPKNWNLVIKEHKAQYYKNFIRWGFRKRSLRQFRKWHNDPRVEIASINYDTFDLIDNAKAIATITGSVGLEALARNKIVLVFGSPVYRNHKSIVKIISKKHLKEVLKNINQYDKNNLQKKDLNNKLFFEMISDNSTTSFSGGFKRQEQLNISEKENLDSYVKYLKAIFYKLNF